MCSIWFFTFTFTAYTLDMHLLGLSKVSAESTLGNRAAFPSNFKEWTFNMVAVGRSVTL